MANMQGRRYWFRAKRYGWGWGLPLTWQGWTVMAAYIGLLFAGVHWLRPEGPFVFLAFVVLLSVALFVVCWLTGEPPKWRWGKR